MQECRYQPDLCAVLMPVVRDLKPALHHLQSSPH